SEQRVVDRAVDAVRTPQVLDDVLRQAPREPDVLDELVVVRRRIVDEREQQLRLGRALGGVVGLAGYDIVVLAVLDAGGRRVIDAGRQRCDQATGNEVTDEL